jgi:hypothetical protein
MPKKIWDGVHTRSLCAGTPARATRAREHPRLAYPYHMRHNPEPRPRDDSDAAKDMARDLAEIATHIGQLKGDANAYLSDPNYDRLKLRLEIALSAVEAATIEARRRVRLNEG